MMRQQLFAIAVTAAGILATATSAQAGPCLDADLTSEVAGPVIEYRRPFDSRRQVRMGVRLKNRYVT